MTRPRPEADNFARALRRAGYRPIIAPLLEIRLMDVPQPGLADDRIVITSLAALRALQANGWSYDLPIICVGAATALRARRMGFTRVDYGGENVEALAAMLRKSQAAAPVLYACGDHVSTDLEALLPGFIIRRVQVYVSLHTAWTPKITNRLLQGEIEWISVFSRRTAQGLAAQLGKASQAAWTRHCSVACLSGNVAEPLSGYRWKQIVVAIRPTAADLIAGLDARPG